MRIVVIRHGESEGDILNVHEGRADFNLTEKGHTQAEAMAEYVSKTYNIDNLLKFAVIISKTDSRYFVNIKTEIPMKFQVDI